MDLIVGLPKIETTEGDYSKILVAVDRFSSRTFLMPCLTNVTASLLGETFVDYVCLEHGRGIPVELISDRDPLPEWSSPRVEIDQNTDLFILADSR